MKSVLLLWLSAFYANNTASQAVDTLEPLLQQNRDAYFAGPRTLPRQAQALAYFDVQWAWLKSPAGCGDRLLGRAGTACLRERARTGKYPWEVWYRDTIVTNSLDPH
jgi:hypothetical protein